MDSLHAGHPLHSMNLRSRLEMRSFLAECRRRSSRRRRWTAPGDHVVIGWSPDTPRPAGGHRAVCVIVSWNEFMFAVNLTATTAGTAPVFLVGFVTSQGLFLAKLCAAATLVSLPVLIAGFAAQDKLVRGLSLGAVK